MRFQSSGVWRDCKRLPANLSPERRYRPPPPPFSGQPGRLKCRGCNFNRLRAIPPFRRILSRSGHPYRRLSMIQIANDLMECLLQI